MDTERELPDPSVTGENLVDENSVSWLDDASLEFDELEVEEYDIVSAPNDWNVSTIVNFIESGAVKIPPFQRNFVWDIKRASKLIESLLLGLPVPQIFLYEEKRNSFLVIDGQQRLLSIFFFLKGRFPKTGSRGAIRSLLAQGVGINQQALRDDNYFEEFKLRLPKSRSNRPNRFNGKRYDSLEEYKITLDLRTLRNVVVKQTSPMGDNSVFEIFSRLNTGGVNLSPQEIRASLYHSELISRVLILNENLIWRRILGVSAPDPRMRDSEIILRSFALGRNLDNYAGSMTSFVNSFCHDAQGLKAEQALDAQADFLRFLDLISDLPEDLFRRQGKFSGVLFESFFAAWIRTGRKASSDGLRSAVGEVKNADAFAKTLQEGSTKTANVKSRIQLAESALTSVRG